MLNNNDLLDIIENFNEKEFFEYYNSYRKEIIVSYNHKIEKSNKIVRLSDIHHEIIKGKAYHVTEEINYLFNYPSKLANLISKELENAFYYDVNYDMYDANSIFLCCKKDGITLEDRVDVTKKNGMGFIGVYAIAFFLFIAICEVFKGALALRSVLNITTFNSLTIGLVLSAPVIFGFVILYILYAENSERKFRKYINL